MTSPEKIAQYNEYLLEISPLNEFRKLIGAPVVEPLLPNFCRGGNTDDRNNWENSADASKSVQKGSGGKYGNLNKNASDRANESEQERLNRLYGGYLPGTDPRYALNNPIPPPDGKNNHYSNTGAEGRYKDTKAIYEHDYLTTVNLGIGILLSLYIISQKA